MRVIFNPSFIWRRPHMLAAVLISASFFVAGISAWYLVKGRAKGFARRSMSIALGIAGLRMPVQLYLGDIPCLGSYIANYLTCKTAMPGLKLTPAADRPDAAATFWGLRPSTA
ncbi:cytochrome ubiquinol oxidase subunit I [Streptomyces phaeochromogenes]|nr:cytochrome ubiquinol oxidase subunit I [Streptomyces phaeochromogenes]